MPDALQKFFIVICSDQQVKQRHGTPRVSNEYVYEDMRNNRQFVAAPEQSWLDLG